MAQEVVYGTQDDTHVVMSEKVQSLAGSIYQEFEKMISKYDEEVVKNLMPLVVNVLECLDLSHTENQEHEVEVELLREDNEQLVTQYEREKQLRKSAEQKLLEMEDYIEDEKKDYQSKIESLESIVRMLELKSKNASDHVYRLEEKEQDMKQEYTKLHERYTELFKTHMDHIERTKILMGSGDRMDNPRSMRMPFMSMAHMNRSSGPVSFGFSSLESPSTLKSIDGSNEYPLVISNSPPGSMHSNSSLKNELQTQDLETSEAESRLRVDQISERGWSETLNSISKADDSSPDEVPEIVEEIEAVSKNSVTSLSGRSHTQREQRPATNVLYQEFSFQDNEVQVELEEVPEITGNWVHPGDYASSVSSETEPETPLSIGMGKEVENLIKENTELLATKNALNIVKDDLIIKVDELTSEQHILREELKALQTLNVRLAQKASEVEEELKKTKQELEQLKLNKSDSDEEKSYAERKRFTRVEMARVILERNKFKEQLMDLEESLRWQETVRAIRLEPNEKKKQGVWRLFSNLFGSSVKPNDTGLGSGDSGGGVVTRPRSIHYDPSSHQVGPSSIMKRRSMIEGGRYSRYEDDMFSDKAKRSDRRVHFGRIRTHIPREESWLQAYGWSMPADPSNGRPLLSMPHQSNSQSTNYPVPVLVNCCSPLADTEPGMKMWCATGVNLSGGVTKDGGEIVGASVFYNNNNNNNMEEPISKNSEFQTTIDESLEMKKLDEELKENSRTNVESELVLSSLIWICTTTNNNTKVVIIDANKPDIVLETFHISCQAHIGCIASVPGALENDYVDNDVINCEPEQTEEVTEEDKQLPKDKNSDVEIGKIMFVSCAAGSEETYLDDSHKSDEILNDINSDKVDDEDSISDSVQANNNSCEIPRRPSLLKEGIIKDGISDPLNENGIAKEDLDNMSSVLPTIWLGFENGCIFVHSAKSQWRRCLHSVKLKDAVLSIIYVDGRVLCALANGTVVVFRRDDEGRWDLSKYHSVTLGPPQNAARCLVSVNSKRVWCGYKNKVHIIHPRSLVVIHTLEAHPHKESKVRTMVWVGDGVWVSIRLDSTIRLYHAYNYNHLQDVDVQPFIIKMLGSDKPQLSCIRITAMLVASNRLWIGTGIGVVISVPLLDKGLLGFPINKEVKVYSEPKTQEITPSSFIPYCSMAHAQLSVHGFRDSVKFFVSVPGSGGFSAASAIQQDEPIVKSVPDAEHLTSTLIIAGGEGYVDFRSDEQGDGDYFDRTEKNQLFLWGVHSEAKSKARLDVNSLNNTI
ncbi:JNK-interacting protein 3 isoform X3 [Rhopalosiphum maidis]|uniref:JNK-interacting protein 3 isoform X3 n=1 Tax=Rhopalosiphum maidis TaxID=43146 RepID=UPI000EFF48CB|nr:JNK-interacting protein 3 isoform X3 [Rhopalosiphum maidis]